MNIPLIDPIKLSKIENFLKSEGFYHVVHGKSFQNKFQYRLDNLLIEIDISGVMEAILEDQILMFSIDAKNLRHHKIVESVKKTLSDICDMKINKMLS